MHEGDVVRVGKGFTTADESLQVMLRAGTEGVVEDVDADGDAQARFLTLSGLRCSVRWVVTSYFGKLVRHQTSEDEKVKADSLLLTQVARQPRDQETTMPTS